MTDQQLHILQHALGADKYGQWPKGHDWYYRDYYIGQDDVADELVVQGFMNKYPGNAATGGDDCYRVTGNGIVAMRQNSPKPPVLSKAKRRYERFLSWSDATGGSFRDFLKSDACEK